MAIRALIVDDEYPAREELRYRLGKYPDVEVVGEATDSREALQLIEALEYDVLFLDVQMPGLSGVELARLLREKGASPRVVFVTAYDEYAVDAFEARAVDYLLKPFDDERLAESIRRLREGQEEGSGRGKGATAPNGKGSGAPRPLLTWVPTERDEKTIPVKVSEIVYISADGDAVFIHTHSEQLRTRFTLQALTERLPSDQFFRCHRSFLINIYQVKEIVPYFNGTYLLVTKDKNHSKIPVSRANVKRLKELFGIASSS